MRLTFVNGKPAECVAGSVALVVCDIEVDMISREGKSQRKNSLITFQRSY